MDMSVGRLCIGKISNDAARQRFLMAKIFVTGALGLIGRSFVDTLISENAFKEVFAAARSIPAFVKGYPAGVKFVRYDALKPVEFDFSVDVIVHAASPASPELFVEKPVETMMANVYGVKELLDYAVRCKAKKFVYVSSSEVYGKAPSRTDGYKEDDYGFVDILDVRSSYPMGKRATETLCVSYVKEYGLDVSIVRPGHIYGPTASPKDKRVSSAFAWAAARGEALVLKSDGASLRSYTHADDCASAIMTVIEKGKSGEAYNIANRGGICSIRQMAEIMADEGGVELRMNVANAEERGAFNPMNNSCLNPSKMESLGWRGKIGYEEGFRQTVRAIKERIRNGTI